MNSRASVAIPLNRFVSTTPSPSIESTDLILLTSTGQLFFILAPAVAQPNLLRVPVDDQDVVPARQWRSDGPASATRCKGRHDKSVPCKSIRLICTFAPSLRLLSIRRAEKEQRVERSQVPPPFSPSFGERVGIRTRGNVSRYCTSKSAVRTCDVLPAVSMAVS